MATYIKPNIVSEDFAHGVHQLNTNQLAVFLTNTAPLVTHSTTADLTLIDTTNLSSRNITTVSSAQTAGVYKLTVADLTLTASGTVPDFRYIYIINTGTTVKTNPILGYYDNGSVVSLTAGQDFEVDFSDTNGFIQVA